MGFPVGYSELLLPRLLLQVLLLLGQLHRFLLWSFHAVGLGDLIDLGSSVPATAQEAHWHAHGATSLQHRRPGFRALPAVSIDEALPVLRFDELVASTPSVCADGDCSVCLCGIGGGDEVRRLSNCRHVFHRGCIDRWMAHEQRTCPLCRAPLMPDDDDEDVAGGASVALPDVSDYELSYPSPLPLMATPTLLRPHELLLNGLGGFQ
jgi:RING-H2 zinc finger protein RHA1